MSVVDASGAPAAAAARRAWRSTLLPRARPLLLTALAVAAGLGAWWLISLFSSPFFFPSPLATLEAALDLIETGDLPRAVVVSYFRILSGWAIGCAAAIPIALVAGRVPLIRALVDPYFNFFRFVPPIAFLGIAILWFGIGE